MGKNARKKNEELVPVAAFTFGKNTAQNISILGVVEYPKIISTFRRKLIQVLT
jgi:hypothetical protein